MGPMKADPIRPDPFHPPFPRNRKMDVLIITYYQILKTISGHAAQSTLAVQN